MAELVIIKLKHDKTKITFTRKGYLNIRIRPRNHTKVPILELTNKGDKTELDI